MLIEIKFTFPRELVQLLQLQRIVGVAFTLIELSPFFVLLKVYLSPPPRLQVLYSLLVGNVPLCSVRASFAVTFSRKFEKLETWRVKSRQVC